MAPSSWSTEIFGSGIWQLVKVWHITFVWLTITANFCHLKYWNCWWSLWSCPGLLMLCQFGGQRYIRILHRDLIDYTIEQSVLSAACVSLNMSLDIAKQLVGFLYLCWLSIAHCVVCWLSTQVEAFYSILLSNLDVITLMTLDVLLILLQLLGAD